MFSCLDPDAFYSTETMFCPWQQLTALLSLHGLDIQILNLVDRCFVRYANDTAVLSDDNIRGLHV